MRTWLTTVVLLALPAVAFADMSLFWNGCFGDPHATERQHLTCTGAADQTYRLMIQFSMGEPFDQARAWTVKLDFWDQTNDLGDATTGFWRMENPCPGSGLRGIAVSHIPPTTCETVTSNVSGDGTTGVSYVAWISNYTSYGGARAGRAVIVGAYARETGIPLIAGTDYYAMHLVFNNWNRTACPDGCADPGAIAPASLLIESDQSYVWVDGGTYGNIVFVNDGSLPTMARNTTWGKIKAQYR